MSLVGTLAKVAVGALVAKGVGGMVKGKAGQAGESGSGGLGDLLGQAGGAGGLGGLLGGAGGSGGLGELLGGLTGGQAGGQQSQTGGAGGLGGLLGGQGGAGGLGGLLESLGGQAGGAAQAPAGGSLGDLLNSALNGGKPPQPTATQEDQAKLLIKAMISAAKSDGSIDQAEQQKIVSQLGDDISEEERQFVIGEMQSPLDIDGVLNSMPNGMQQQVYMMSIMGIDLDTKAEADYLDALRQRLGISEQACNSIHDQLGVPVLFG